VPKSRLEAFSDGIIAFAITLLILDIHLQDVSADITNAGMIEALLALVPHFLIYVISFLICTVWWVSHHALIHDLDHVDPRLLWLNSLFLMWIAVLPFPTGLLGHHPRQPVAIALYGTVCAMTCVSFSMMRWYASFPGHLTKKEIDETQLRRDMRLSLCFPVLYLSAAVAGFLLPWLGWILYTAIPGVYAVGKLVNYRDTKSRER
jgi:TMEM175 potassium channel family protein